MNFGIYKIEAMAIIAGEPNTFDLFFTDRGEADKAYAFLEKVEGIVQIEYSGLEPLTFDIFKDKLGEQFDVVEEEVSFSRTKTANTVAA